MAPSAFYRQTWGDPSPLPPDKLRPAEEIHDLLSRPRRQGSTLPPSPFEIETVHVNGRTMANWKYLPRCYRDFWVQKAKEFASCEYIVYEGETMTYSQAHAQSLTTAHWLASQFQVRRGDRVGICARNNLEHVTTFWACHLLGAVATELNAFADADTLQFCVRDAGCRVVLCDVERLERIRPALKRVRTAGDGATAAAASSLLATTDNDEVNALRGIVVIPFGRGRGQGRIPRSQRTYLAPQLHTAAGETEASSSSSPALYEPANFIFDFEDLTARWAPSTPASPPDIDILPEDNATILFTSGTTGRPKGVISTQRQSLHNLGATLWLGARIYLRRYRPLPDPTKNPERVVTLMCFPLFHAAGLLSQLVTGTSQGHKLVYLYAWDVDHAVDLVRTHAVTRLSATAFMARQLATHPADLPSLGAISHGGSSSPAELAQEAFKKTQGGLVGNGYGATETNAFAAGCYQDDYLNWPDSVGYAAPTTEIKIMDPVKLVEVPQGHNGEVWIRGPGIASGYWNRPAATREAFLPDGFYRTGDIGCLNAYGALFIRDRVKDLIIRGGENISCTVVEGGCYAHPSVMEAAAVALPDRMYGERVAVVCVVRGATEGSGAGAGATPGGQGATEGSSAASAATPQGQAEGGATATEASILAAARRTLANKQEHPEFIHVQTEPLPKNPAGKVDKKVLRERVKDVARERGWGDFGEVKSKL